MASNLAPQLNTLADIFAQVDFLPKARKQRAKILPNSLGFGGASCLVQNAPFDFSEGGCPSSYTFCLYIEPSEGVIIPGIAGDFSNHTYQNGLFRIVCDIETENVYAYRFTNLLTNFQTKAALSPPDYDRFAQLPQQFPFLNSLFSRYLDKSRIWSVNSGLTQAQHVELTNISKQIREKLFAVSRGAAEKKELYQKAIHLAESIHLAHKTASKPPSSNSKILESQVLSYFILNWNNVQNELSNAKQLISLASTLPVSECNKMIDFTRVYKQLRIEADASNTSQNGQTSLRNTQQTWQSMILPPATLPDTPL